ncbi:MAG: GNAT family N-acetyltransferase, partial [Ilumatobacteraceae bacterium]
EYWGRGIATAALTAFLGEVTERPLHADVLKTNVGSLRVLQKCGFRLHDDDERGADHDPKEYTLRLGSGLVPLAANGVRQHGRAGPRWAGVPISGGRWCMLR